ncbi:MAG: hypothetical protein IPH22_10745 [Nitrosomonas sp.]|nr:hypothetical protein [Nitrosomonas sp.]
MVFLVLGGLTVAIEPPELEMRVLFLLKANLGGYVLDEAVAFLLPNM